VIAVGVPTVGVTVTTGSVPVLLLAPCEAVLKVLLLNAEVVQVAVVAVILVVNVMLK
jgi:hypothetical protein